MTLIPRLFTVLAENSVTVTALHKQQSAHVKENLIRLSSICGTFIMKVLFLEFGERKKKHRKLTLNVNLQSISQNEQKKVGYHGVYWVSCRTSYGPVKFLIIIITTT